jgi:hypothetical protein
VAAFAVEAAATGVVGEATAKAGVATGDEALRSSGASPREAAASSVKSRRTGRTGVLSGTVGAGDGAAVGVATAGTAVGMITAGIAVGMITAGIAAGMITAGIAVGMITAGIAAGMITAGIAAGMITAGIAVGMITAPLDLVVLDPPSLLFPSPPSAGARVRVRGSADRRAPPLARSALSLTLSRGRERGSEAAGGPPTTVGENRTGAGPTTAVATAPPATIVVGMWAAAAERSVVRGGAPSTCDDLRAVPGCGFIAGCSRE